MFSDGESPNTCMNLFKRYTSAFQGWLDGGFHDRRMFCEAVNLYIGFDIETVKICAAQLQEIRLKFFMIEETEGPWVRARRLLPVL